MTNPIDHEELYDRMIVEGVLTPGKVTLSGHARSEKWDVKEGDGQGGASVTRKGEQLSKFTAAFQLVLDTMIDVDEYAEWEAFLPVLKSCTAGKDPKPLAVYHPDLAELGISSVVVEEIGGKQYDGMGGATVSVKFLEYRPPKPKTGSPKPSSKSPDPNADAKLTIDTLLNAAAAP